MGALNSPLDQNIMMKSPWFYLVLAISTEVVGTLAMNESGHSGGIGSYCAMYVFICASYMFLSLALKEIAVGIAIAVWEALGTALISVISLLFLHEPFSAKKFLGIALAIAGIVLLKFGEDKSDQNKEKLL